MEISMRGILLVFVVLFAFSCKNSNNPHNMGLVIMNNMTLNHPGTN